MSAEVNVAARKEELIAAQGELELGLGGVARGDGRAGSESPRVEAY